ncbi:MAG TPA: hypothetical protein VHV32_00265 [Candidatus Angelobacter sp.]|jgi:hypothetical protein|nr:hypothetical protein [Candidatus Angelobacter sp.]
MVTISSFVIVLLQFGGVPLSNLFVLFGQIKKATVLVACFQIFVLLLFLRRGPQPPSAALFFWLSNLERLRDFRKWLKLKHKAKSQRPRAVCFWFFWLEASG